MTTFEGPPLEQGIATGARTFGGFVEQLAERHGSSEAIAFDDPLRDGLIVRWSHADLRDAARGVALGLLSAGVLPGESVAVLMGNRPEAVASILGIGMIGGVAVPVSTFARGDELATMLRVAKVSGVLTQTSLLDRRLAEDVDEVRARLAGIRFVAAVGDDTWGGLLADGDTVPEALLDERRAEVTPAAPALVIFSSGTTATPKAMLHSHGGTTHQFWQLAGVYGRHPGTRLWSAFPIFWTAGLNTAVGATLAAGGCWVAQETFDAGTALALLARERVTEPYALPHQIGALAEHPAWERTDLSALRSVYGTSAFARHPTVDGDPNWTFPVGYGLSETGATFVSHPSSAPREAMQASTGRLLPGNQLRVLDVVTGQPLGPDEHGELVVKGPTLMLRYLGQDPSTCFDEDGFFHTGDTGYVDAAGEVHYTGRRTEMIKTGGANVAPAELEVQLRACEPVKLARIVGVPDDRYGELVVACIVLKDGATADEADIRAFLRGRVASFKVPRRVLFFEDGEIPMTSSGAKVRDEELDALVAARLAAAPTPTPSGDR